MLTFFDLHEILHSTQFGLMRDRFLHSRYVKVHAHKYSSIWPEIKHFYDIILKNTLWIVSQGDTVNF